MIKSNKVSYWLICVLFLAGGAAVYYFYVKPSFFESYNTALNVFYSGDRAGALQALSDTAANAPDKATEAKARDTMAYILFTSSKAADKAQGLQMYQQLIADTSVPANARALALAELGSIVSSNGNAYMQQNFSQPPLNYYQPPIPGDGGFSLPMTSINILKASDNLSPNSYAEYTLAYYYGVAILNGALGTSTPKELATLAQYYIDQGDKNVATTQYQTSVLAIQYLDRAVGMMAANRVLGTPSLDQCEQAFNLALSTATAQTPMNPQVLAVSMRIRQTYASFLVMNNFGRDRSEDIKNILQPFANAVSNPADYPVTRATYLNVSTYPDSSLQKINVIKLAGISPDFKSFLVSLGWKL